MEKVSCETPAIPDPQQMIRLLEGAVSVATKLGARHVNLSYAEVHDILALLKEKKPRVLTPEEVRVLPPGTDVWIEMREGDIRVDTSYPSSDGRWFETALHGYILDDYGEAWRVWTARPTEKQQKEATWNG